HNRADRLVGGLSDRPTDRLDDINLRPARVDERDTIESRQVDTLREAARVGENGALIALERAEAVEAAVALTARHLAGDVLCPESSLGSAVERKPGAHVQQRTSK